MYAALVCLESDVLKYSQYNIPNMGAATEWFESFFFFFDCCCCFFVLLQVWLLLVNVGTEALKS